MSSNTVLPARRKRSRSSARAFDSCEKQASDPVSAGRLKGRYPASGGRHLFSAPWSLASILVGLVLAIGSAPARGDEPALVPRVSGSGAAQLKPTRIIVSVPLSVQKEEAADAIAELRQLRVRMVEKAIEMGAQAEAIKIAGYECTQEGNSRSIPNVVRRANRPPEPEAKQSARCYLVATFPAPAADDYEALLAIGQTLLADLQSTLPQNEQSTPSSRSSYFSGPVDVRRLEGPLVLFAAEPSDEEVKAAYRQALDRAKTKFKAVAATAGPLAGNRTILVSTGNQYVSSTLRSHPVAEAVGISDSDYVVSVYPDGLSYQLSVTLSSTTSSVVQRQ